MADDQVSVNFKTTYDGKGADQAAQSVKKVEDAAKKSATGLGALEESLKKVSSKMELVNKVFSGLGLIGLIGGVVTAVSNLKKKLDDAAEAARKITLEKISKDNENAVKGLATEYDALLKTIEAVNAAILRQRELEAARMKNKRDMEDVQAEMGQQDELDKLDRKDPLYKEKAGEIRARYKSLSVERQSGRESEDIQSRMQIEGDKIKGFRSTEVANRSAAENVWSEYSRQQQQISGLESPVMKRRRVSYGAAMGGGSYEEQYEDKSATKQNQAAAEELRKKLPELEKKARQYVAIADEAGNQAVHAANMASTISTARTVSIAKAGVMTQGAAAGRADAYTATDVAQEALDKQLEEKRIKDEEDKYNQKAIPAIQQSQAQLEAAKQRAEDARLTEQQAAMEVRARKDSFAESGSRNTNQFRKEIEPAEGRVVQSRSAREKAEQDVKALTASLEILLSTYGEGFKQLSAKINRASVQQKLDATN